VLGWRIQWGHLHEPQLEGVVEPLNARTPHRHDSIVSAATRRSVGSMLGWVMRVRSCAARLLAHLRVGLELLGRRTDPS
jgi:hypothetical protein